MYCAGLILVLVSVLGKFGAALASIPDPVLADAVAVMLGMLMALGLSTLQYVDLNSERNLLIVGTAFFAGWLFPQWIQTDPNLINTGSREGNNILKLLFGTPLLLGGMIAIVLDNTVLVKTEVLMPGSGPKLWIDRKKEKGPEVDKPEMEMVMTNRLTFLKIIFTRGLVCTVSTVDFLSVLAIHYIGTTKRGKYYKA